MLPFRGVLNGQNDLFWSHVRLISSLKIWKKNRIIDSPHPRLIVPKHDKPSGCLLFKKRIYTPWSMSEKRAQVNDATRIFLWSSLFCFSEKTGGKTRSLFLKYFLSFFSFKPFSHENCFNRSMLESARCSQTLYFFPLSREFSFWSFFKLIFYPCLSENFK